MTCFCVTVNITILSATLIGSYHLSFFFNLFIKNLSSVFHLSSIIFLFFLFFRLGVGHLITTTCKDVCGKYSNDEGGFSGVADQIADAGRLIFINTDIYFH